MRACTNFEGPSVRIWDLEIAQRSVPLSRKRQTGVFTRRERFGA